MVGKRREEKERLKIPLQYDNIRKLGVTLIISGIAVGFGYGNL